MAEEVHCIAMIFDTTTGKLKDVKPIDPNVPPINMYPTATKGEITTPIGDKGGPGPIIIAKFKHTKLNLNSFAHEWGSPGCETYDTQAGPVRICW